MSTEFNGEYCSHKDKMKLGRTEAAQMAKRMGNARTYQCDECGGWHLTHESKRKGSGFRKKLLRPHQGRKIRR